MKRYKLDSDFWGHEMEYLAYYWTLCWKRDPCSQNVIMKHVDAGENHSYSEWNGELMDTNVDVLGPSFWLSEIFSHRRLRRLRFMRPMKSVPVPDVGIHSENIDIFKH